LQWSHIEAKNRQQKQLSQTMTNVLIEGGAMKRMRNAKFFQNLFKSVVSMKFGTPLWKKKGLSHLLKKINQISF